MAADIVIWIEGREKRVNGLTRKTTCADILRALVRGGKTMDMDDYTLYERWGDCERPLSAKTKIYKVWQAWGDEQDNVKFTLKKSKPKHGSDSGGKAKRTNNENDNNNRIHPSKHKTSHRHKEGKGSKHVLETLEGLIQVVIMQDHRIQELLQRIKHTDEEIEYYETCIHVERQKENGKNYVQDSYLTDAEDDVTPTSRDLSLQQNMDSYVTVCESLLQLDQELVHNENTIDKLTQQLEIESLGLNLSNNDGRHRTEKAESFDEEDKGAELEVSNLKHDLENRIQIGLEQRKQLQHLQQAAQNKESVLDAKRKQLECLLCELELLDNNENDVSGDVTIADIIDGTDMLSKDNDKDGCYDNESDADTGLSSMHSQDDDSPLGVVETLV
ncbi:ras association domain-containing protein 10-like [Glandiceps talaboti]